MDITKMASNCFSELNTDLTPKQAFPPTHQAHRFPNKRKSRPEDYLEPLSRLNVFFLLLENHYAICDSSSEVIEIVRGKKDQPKYRNP